MVPFHNEQENVTVLYDRLKAVMEAAGSRVVVVKLRRNFGQTSAHRLPYSVERLLRAPESEQSTLQELKVSLALLVLLLRDKFRLGLEEFNALDEGQIIGRAAVVGRGLMLADVEVLEQQDLAGKT